MAKRKIVYRDPKWYVLEDDKELKSFKKLEEAEQFFKELEDKPKKGKKKE